MPTQDSDEFRALLARLLPGLVVTEVAQPSGQRIVYFGRFTTDNSVNEQHWLPIDPSSWGQVVIKVSCGVPPETITYLQREISVLTELNSEYYPRLYFHEVFHSEPDSEEVFKERLFVTIEQFIESEPLSACRTRFSTEKDVVRLLVDLVNALKLLWDQKPPLIHRDIKPENILIRPEGSPVIIDLGIVRVEGEAGVTNTEAIFGPCTPNFSSPEQARNDKSNITFKSDVFSLGTLTHLLIAGANPFNPEGRIPLLTVLESVCNKEVPSLENTHDVSKGFSELVDQMMQKEPYRRPRTPAILLDLLDEI